MYPNYFKINMFFWKQTITRAIEDTISRASIINFLEAMRGMGVLSGVETTGKSGHHWFYYPTRDEAGFKRCIAENLLKKLISEFPEALANCR